MSDPSKENFLFKCNHFHNTLFRRINRNLVSLISLYLYTGQGRLHIYSNPLLLFVKDLDTEISPGSKILEGVVCDDGEYLGLTSEGNS